MQREVLPALVNLPLPRVTAMKAQDMHIRLIDPTGKRQPVINQHRVWDRDRFYAAQVKLHEIPPRRSRTAAWSRLQQKLNTLNSGR